MLFCFCLLFFLSFFFLVFLFYGTFQVIGRDVYMSSRSLLNLTGKKRIVIQRKHHNYGAKSFPGSDLKRHCTLNEK